ncbi:hypothetical protein ACI65C_009931 [Semiaphis heraclei]
MDNASQTAQESDTPRRWENDYEDEVIADHGQKREPSPITRYFEAQKRKMDVTPPPAADPGTCELEAGLQYMRSALKTAAQEARIARSKEESPEIKRIVGLLEDLTKTLGNLISKKGKLRTATPPPSPLPKKTKSEATIKPVMVDAATDTILTPSWWDSDAVFEAKTRRTRTARKTRAEGITNERGQTRDTEVESAVDTDAEAPWSSVVKRGAKKRSATTTASRPPAVAAPPKPPSKPNRPPAILVRPAAGKSYTDTVRSVEEDPGQHATQHKRLSYPSSAELARARERGQHPPPPPTTWTTHHRPHRSQTLPDAGRMTMRTR